MNKLFRVILFVFALVIGGWLGITLLMDFEFIKIFIFFVICSLLGAVLHQIDKRIFGNN